MSHRGRPDPLAIVEKLARAERDFQASTFLAPVVAGGQVSVRIQGIVCRMFVEQKDFEGWAVLRAVSSSTATIVGNAPPEMVSSYLRNFLRVRLVLLDQVDKCWWALPASTADRRITISGPVPVRLMGPAAQFETIYARFDGTSFWFECKDRRRDPQVARDLRKSLSQDVHPNDLKRAGMVPQELLSYRMLYLRAHPEMDERPQPPALDDGRRISRALNHAGASLDAFWYQCDGTVTVRFRKGESVRTTVIDPRDLTVLNAGICLSGMDHEFDLTSLVSVLDEAPEEMY